MIYSDIIIFFLIITTLGLILLTLPVKLAATAMKAQRTGTGWCLLSILGAYFMQGVGLTVPVAGPVVAFLLSSAAFAGILGTDFLRGIGIAILQTVFSIAVFLILGALFGISLSSLLIL